MHKLNALRLLCRITSVVLLVVGVAVEARTPDIHAIVAKRVAQAGAPGAAYVFVRDGRAEAGVVGVASSTDRTPLSVDTPLALGSVSKPFTAIGVLQLVDRGLVDLDAPISRYLAWVRFADPNAADRITVRHLLTHTSGLSTFDGNQTQSDLSMEPGALRRRVEGLASVTPGPPGIQWQYSNSNYQLLGALIEEVSGLGYPTYVERNIFAPLGMTRSFVLIPPPGIQPATGHRRWFGVLRPVEYRALGLGSGPQGGIYTSAQDMGKFLNAFMSERSPLLSDALRAEMLRPQQGAPMQGLGWRIGAPSRPGFVWHGGDNPGFAAFAGFDPEAGAGLAVMTNLGFNLVLAPAHGITMGTAGEYFDLPPVPARSSPFNIAFVASLALATILAVFHTVRLFARRKQMMNPSRSVLRMRLSAVAGILVIMLGLAILLVPRFLFGGSISTAWVFMPDMVILLVTCAASLALAGTVHVALLARQRTVRQTRSETTPRPQV